jgi:hypothetical protein
MLSTIGSFSYCNNFNFLCISWIFSIILSRPMKILFLYHIVHYRAYNNHDGDCKVVQCSQKKESLRGRKLHNKLSKPNKKIV